MGSFRDESNKLVRPEKGGKFFITSTVEVLGATLEANVMMDCIGERPRRGRGEGSNGDFNLMAGSIFTTVSE
jgi:hypothetical protein